MTLRLPITLPGLMLEEHHAQVARHAAGLVPGVVNVDMKFVRDEQVLEFRAPSLNRGYFGTEDVGRLYNVHFERADQAVVEHQAIPHPLVHDPGAVTVFSKGDIAVWLTNNGHGLVVWDKGTERALFSVEM